MPYLINFIDVPQQLGSNSASVSSQSIKYAGLVYYEEKGVEDLVTFTAAKKLNALLKVTRTFTHHWFIS